MREPTYDEETAILGFFEAASKGMARKITGRLTLAVHDEVVYLVPKSAWGLPPEILEEASPTYRIGSLEPEGFALDLQGAVLWARASKAQIVRVTEKAARIFLYGKNILGTSVENYARGLDRGDACIVVNPRGEALGIGEVVGSFKGKREAVTPIHDLGEYLRDQSIHGDRGTPE